MQRFATPHEVSQVNRRLYRAFLLREELRLLFHLPDPMLAPAHLDAWLASHRSRLPLHQRLDDAPSMNITLNSHQAPSISSPLPRLASHSVAGELGLRGRSREGSPRSHSA
jgi:hypothetical protein